MAICLAGKETDMIISGILAAINVIVFILLSFGGATEDAYYMYEKGAMFVPAILYDQEYYRMFTSMFMHFLRLSLIYPIAYHSGFRQL